jgi:hypothetical protein
MTRWVVKTKRYGRKGIRTLPGVLVLSVVIHSGLFILAGMIVVFPVTRKEEYRFSPPKPVDRPKMPPRKLKVPVKKAVRPRSPIPLISTGQWADRVAFQFPELASAGMDDLLGDMAAAGFEPIPDLYDADGALGSARSIGNDLEGTFYDFKRNRRGNFTGAGNNTYKVTIRKFLHRNWQCSMLSGFYRSPRKIYATMIVVPPGSSAVAPIAFGEDDAVGRYWMIHYQGALVYREDITFRFRGSGDEIMAVRVDGELVLAACWYTDQEKTVGDLWASHSSDSRKYYMGNDRAVVGDWITLEAGVPRRMEVLLGDNGGEACAMLAVEVKGVEYERNRQGGPILPAFKTAEPSLGLLDVIYKDLPIGEICLTNGPVFSDY